MKTNDNRYTEQDWKLFKSRIAGWQEAYMDKLNKGYIELLSGEGLASDKFWKLENRMKNLYLIGGTMGVGKISVCQRLKSKLKKQHVS